MCYSTQRQSAGFSLIETLVAITILLLVVVGPLSISSRTAKSANYASEQAIAHFLAQEGLELAQKGRDDLVLQYLGTAIDPWDVFIDPAGPYGACRGTTGCGLTITNAGGVSLVDCATTGACALWESTASPLVRPVYRHGSASATSTPYTRTIRFEQADTRQIKVVSEVTWRTGTILANQRVRLETYLFNVYDNP